MLSFYILNVITVAELQAFQAVVMWFASHIFVLPPFSYTWLLEIKKLWSSGYPTGIIFKLTFFKMLSFGSYFEIGATGIMGFIKFTVFGFKEQIR